MGFFVSRRLGLLLYYIGLLEVVYKIIIIKQITSKNIKILYN